MMVNDRDSWTKGTGVISHTDFTTLRIVRLVNELESSGVCTSSRAWKLLLAADRICSMGMWLTVHMTYAKRIYLDGRSLEAGDFKSDPEGHTGGALNMVPAYVGYLLANALTGRTRAWLMGQGHSVAAIEAVNCLLRNLDNEQASRYPLSDTGLSQLCQDFYGYRVSASGKPEVPLGSHVGVYTAGGISEGGYLGFAELQYVHMPLPGQELVTFLSDGAFEEQRGSDWSPRWWRGEDTGLVMPIMIANGRRIDQRTTMAQSGGVEWLEKHLRLNGFSPIEIDGRDPAAFAWAILTMASDLSRQTAAISEGKRQYPVQLPYTIAETTKGYGFPGAGTNSAHNLPLRGNPSADPAARQEFNEGATRLFIDIKALHESCAAFSNHQEQKRELEKDHCLRHPRVEQLQFPNFDWSQKGLVKSPMEQIDLWFQALAEGNPGHRFRVGNPDEMRSNRMNRTLDFLQHRVVAPEPDVTESLTGSVITALNEEAVVSAALANKQGVNLVVSYEAFAVKMLGAMRQEAIFARHFIEANRPVNWLSVP
ncbi:MAG: xylulose 5-phosphate 3-epimerase, partial [Gammaproteobacteria bacterium]|nr:xylulose 5-phosphate 3-epimerase [Gammaproteobacteria bacterium]